MGTPCIQFNVVYLNGLSRFVLRLIIYLLPPYKSISNPLHLYCFLQLFCLLCTKNKAMPLIPEACIVHISQYCFKDRGKLGDVCDLFVSVYKCIAKAI